MEEKFIAAWEDNRAKAEKLGVRMRPLDVKGARRILSGTRLSDGFSLLAQKGLYYETYMSQYGDFLKETNVTL